MILIAKINVIVPANEQSDGTKKKAFLTLVLRNSVSFAPNIVPHTPPIIVATAP